MNSEKNFRLVRVINMGGYPVRMGYNLAGEIVLVREDAMKLMNDPVALAMFRQKMDLLCMSEDEEDEEEDMSSYYIVPPPMSPYCGDISH